MAPCPGPGPPCLVDICIQAAASADLWKLQRRRLEVLPEAAANELLTRLLRQPGFGPSQLELFRQCATSLDMSSMQPDAQWMAVLADIRHLAELRLANCLRLKDAQLLPLTRVAGCLRRLDLSGCTKLTTSGLETLLALSRLEHLDVSDTGMRGSIIQALASLTTLTSLSVGGLHVTDEDCTHLPHLSSLKSLELWGAEVTDAILFHLAELTQLSRLNLAWTGVNSVPVLPKLKVLNMERCTVHDVCWIGGHDQQLASTVHRWGLQVLRLSGSNLTAGLAAVCDAIRSCAPSLTDVDLSNTSVKDLSCLASASNLAKLDLSQTCIRDGELQKLQAATCITELNLSSCPLRGPGLTALASLTNLKVLGLNHTPITDDYLPALLELTSLTCLDLSYTEITAEVPQLAADEPQLAGPANVVADEILAAQLAAAWAAGAEDAVAAAEGNLGVRDALPPLGLPEEHLDIWLPPERHLTESAVASEASAALASPAAHQSTWGSLQLLRVLDLREAPVSREGAQQLSELARNLRSLQLGGRTVDDGVVAQLALLTGLRALWLQGPFSGGALRILSQLPRLKQLELRNSPLLQRNHLLALLEQMPRLAGVVWDGLPVTRATAASSATAAPGSSSSSMKGVASANVGGKGAQPSGSGCSSKTPTGVGLGVVSLAGTTLTHAAVIERLDERFRYSQDQMMALRQSPWVGRDHGGEDMRCWLVEQLPRHLRADLIW